MINILFSGIDKTKGFTKMQTEVLQKDINNNMNIVFISSLFDNYQRSDDQLNRYMLLFERIGIKFNDYCIIDNRINPNQAYEKINNSDIVFLLGGSPELQMKSINDYKLLESIFNAKIVIGVSAGSMNQSIIVMYKDEFDNCMMKKYNGLGLINVNIFPHMSFDNEKLIDEANEISMHIPLILLPNESFIRIENGHMSISGLYWNLDKKILLNGN